MPPPPIHTEHFNLIPGSLELAGADLNDRGRFARLLGARVEDWPPPLYDQDNQRYILDAFTADPDPAGWSTWYFVLRGESGDRIAAGIGGFKGKPTPEGSVEVGYSLLPAYHGRGYGTEIVRALTAWVFDHPEVACVTAETLPELTPSIRVLEKNGFRLIGQGSESGVIRYELKRASPMV